MSRAPLFSIASLPLCTALFLAFAPSAAPEQAQLNSVPSVQEAKATATQDPQLTLGQHMQRMKRQLRRLKRSWDKEDGGVAALRDMSIVLQHLVATKDLIPALAESEPEEKRPEFVKRYRLMMIQTIQKWLEVELAYVRGDKIAASKHLEEFRALETEGHKQFKK